MHGSALYVDRLTRRFGSTRVLALPLLRILAVLSGFAWVAVAPTFPGMHAVVLTVVAFFLYSATVLAALWTRPARMLRLNFWVLLVDLGFALTLIHLTGGARSTLFLALLLIAGLQSYYYGIARGIAVAVGSALAYLLVVWPTISGLDWANIVIRLLTLIGTALGVGVLGDVEEGERRKVLALTEEAQARERFIRSVVESIREGVVAVDAAGRVFAWNTAMEARYGVSAAEVLDRDVFEVFPNIRREPWGGSLQRLLRGEVREFTAEAVEHETPRKGFVVQNLKGNLLNHGGRPAGAVLLAEDITERVGLERSARQTEKLAALGTLAAGLAHELNNPIGIISSRAELMLLEGDSRALPEDLRDDLAVIHRHAQRVARIAQGLLSFSRHSAGQLGPVDLNRVIDETLLLAEKQIVEEGVVLKRSLAPALPAVWGDANALQQVVLNLLTNARDAIGRQGEISVETSPASRAGAVRLRIRDTGPGIAPEVLPRIFDPFFTTKSAGTGLGLSVSYGIVREHRGTVDVESKPGQGTTFTLTLPARSDA
jgi:PAS domain S-box-containing protein